MPTTRQTKIRATRPLTKQEQFFFDHAAVCWTPGQETTEQGRLRGAKEYAQAETWAVQNGYSFQCEHDPHADSSWCRTKRERLDFEANAWYMQMLDENGKVVQSLSGCDGGEDYKRVVRAELALEEMKTNA